MDAATVVPILVNHVFLEVRPHGALLLNVERKYVDRSATVLLPAKIERSAHH